jgi:hypothetical protein
MKKLELGKGAMSKLKKKIETGNGTPRPSTSRIFEKNRPRISKIIDAEEHFFQLAISSKRCHAA